jgi:hypothetical protein
LEWQLHSLRARCAANNASARHFIGEAHESS